MAHAYKYLLVLLTLALPGLVMVWGNRFQRAGLTFLRFIVAVVAVWVWLLCVRFLVDAIDIRLTKTPEELHAIYAADGAANAVALLFGWVPGVLLSVLAWGLGRVWRWLRRGRR